MPETQREKITKRALEVLENNPTGVRCTELFRKLAEILPNVPQNTIHGTIWDLDKRNNQIMKPERGLFILRQYATGTTDRRSDVGNNAHLPREASFYQSFADYLVQDLEECTKAISLGGNIFGDRWGTPDVFGVYKFSEADAVRPLLKLQA